jgi:hypothetical protein
MRTDACEHQGGSGENAPRGRKPEQTRRHYEHFHEVSRPKCAQETADRDPISRFGAVR